ncbi:hypothetical protein SmJEL517_g03288 [Synchytrium microbalum]|uniref:C-CAP/cofactor C-like domain-containing protein n=1 Tax=Synchytrium microbalum TaxID=1806994 RepID=A0A507C434_9FUNG|nr:uncharacterized protein SmJEL517_g03288 [Synchytrium microbalum]TPX33849.1 hypothetical protein SmJEL517_g03288 [Synchytrium microbalum]
MASSTGASSEFYTLYQTERVGITQDLDLLKTTPPTAIAAKCDDLLSRINALQEKINAATIYLPQYDQRQLALQTRQLSDELAVQRAALLPKSKFSFKSTRATVTAPVATKQNVDPVPAIAKPAEDQQYQPSPNSYSITTKANTYITTTQQDRHHQQEEAYIQQLSSCVVDLSDMPSLAAVYISDLRDCVVRLPPVNGSVWVDRCQNLILFAACRQFRMHQTSKADIYLHVKSHPIIEHCTKINFGRYILSDESLQRTQLDPQVNHYTSVEDFDWLKQHASPNWSTMTDDKQNKTWEAKHPNETVESFVTRWL